MNATDPILVLDKVLLGFRQDADATPRISLTMSPSEFIVIAGPSGAEKSELLLTAAGFREARNGTVRLLGAKLADLRAFDSPALRCKIGFVFAEPIFIHDLSAIENIQLPLRYDDLLTPQQMGDMTEEVVRAAGLSGDLSRMIDSLPPLERCRLALARAWIRRPAIVFYDEPAKGLDPASQMRIHQAISRYHEQRNRDGDTCGAFLACNDPRWVLDYADRYLLLNAGTLTSKADRTNIRGRQEALEKDFLESIQVP